VHKIQRRDFNGLAIYIMWNLWKEQNRRIFENKLESAQQVAERIKKDLVQFKRAFSNTAF
jgi:glutaredoxin 2